MNEASILDRCGGLLAVVVALLSTLAAAGCALDEQAPLPSGTMTQLVAEGELSPVCGQSFEGSLNAHVPLHGVSPTPADAIQVEVYDAWEEAWVVLGTAASDPIALVQVHGEPMYAFDLGVACGYDCELTIPPGAWAGTGPFRARFRLHSETHGYLPARSLTDPERLGCGAGDQAEIIVFAEPLERHHH